MRGRAHYLPAAGPRSLSMGAGAGDAALADLGDFTAAPDGDFDGQFGIDDNGVLWRWYAAISQWLRGAPIDGIVLEPSAVVSIVEQDPTAAGWTESIAAGGAADYDNTVADRVALLAGTAGSSRTSAEVGTAPSDPEWIGLLLVDVKAADVAGVNAVDILAPYYESDTEDPESGTDRKVGLNISTGTSATNWLLVQDGGNIDTGIAFGTEARIEMWFDVANGHVKLFKDRDVGDAFTDVTVTGATTGNTVNGYVAAFKNTTQSLLSFSAYYRIDAGAA